MVYILLALLALVPLTVVALWTGLAIRRYSVSARGLHKPLTVMLLADHHATRYGKAQERLLAKIHAEKPDLILMAGDMIDDLRKPEQALALFRGLRQYPCYYVLGNHENRRTDLDEMAKTVADTGVHLLSDELVRVELEGGSLLIGGLEDPSRRSSIGPTDTQKAAWAKAFAPAADSRDYSVLIAHRPEHIDLYASFGFDLVVSGHTHGGQWRIPCLLNGVWAPGQGFFPKIAGGVYHRGRTTLVLSRGLAKFRWLPRVFNRPELVVIRLEPGKEI